MATTVQVQSSVSLAVECCIECGCHFGIPAAMQHQRRQDKKVFYCPSGHPQCYTVSDADKLRRENALLTSQLDQQKAEAQRQRELKEEALRREIAQKGVVTRLKSKAKAGECPCCNTRFVNLEAHMRDEHPDFNAEEAE